ncbi:MAG TPA: glycosyltransferase family 39 protein, partial [Anaerolineales bacterium]|nr:glycosyltransferase family 39 protein [Anaerolineales bacterium]
MRIPLKSALILILFFFISLAGCLAIHYATYWGPWAYSDSTEYVAAARSLLAGNGLGYRAASGDFILYSLHPPLYPLVLSVLGMLGFDFLEAARWLNIMLVGLTVFLTGTSAYTLLRSTWLAVALTLALLTIPAFIDISSGAMPEPLFLFTSCLAIALLIFYLDRGNRVLLVGSAVSASIAVMARYPGIVVVISCILGLLVSGNRSLKRRVMDAITYSLVSITPLAAWLIWLFSQTRSLAVRTFLLPGDIQASLMALRKSLMGVFLSWLPYREYLPSYNYTTGRNYLIILVTGIAVLGSLIIIRRLFKLPILRDQYLVSTFAFLWALFSIGNILLLAVTYLLTTPTPDLNPRTLLPVQFGAIFFVVMLLASVVDEFQLPDSVSLACGLMILFFIYPNTVASNKLIDRYHQSGLGYTSAAWHSSLTLQAVRDMSAKTPIITN